MTHLTLPARRLALHCSILVIVSLMASAALAGPIERACNKSDRKAANRSVCNCIQQAADSTLSNRDQRRAAGFSRTPKRPIGSGCRNPKAMMPFGTATRPLARKLKPCAAHRPPKI
jgi:hypothetical protein